MRKIRDKLTSRIEVDPDSDDMLLIIPPELIESGEFKVGDEIEVKRYRKSAISIKNLSCEVLGMSRFIRNANSLMKKLENENNFLERVLVTENGIPKLWLLSFNYYEKLKRLETLAESSDSGQSLDL